MPFVKKPQVFSAKINELTLGTGDQAVTLGGQNVYNLYAFDAPIANRPQDRHRRLRRPRAALRGPEGLLRRLRHPGPAGRQGRRPGGRGLRVHPLRSSPTPTAPTSPWRTAWPTPRPWPRRLSKPIVVAGCKNAEKDADLFCQGLRGPPGQEHPGPLRQGGELQGHRRRRRPGLRPEGGRRVRRGHQPGQAAQRPHHPDGRGRPQRGHERRLRRRRLRL